MASFYIPLSGLDADSTALNTIANDLSNMNTTAFKAQTTNFSDLFYQQVGTAGSGNSIQMGEGVQVASNETDFGQGSYDTSGTTSSDVALDGNGFFVVSNGGSNVYTRDGDFTQNTNGNLVTSDGLAVMGYPAVNGVVNTSAPLAPINIPLIGQVQQPQATSNMSMTANLDSTASSGTQFPASTTVYDSMGVPYTATVTYEAMGNNTWSYSAALPASAFVGGVSTPITGTMTFSDTGTLQSITPTGAAGPSTVGTATGDASSIPFSFGAAAGDGLADGASPLSINFNLLDSSGNPTITQVDSPTVLSAAPADGYKAGVYQSFTIGSDGTVTASYSNGQTQAVGQLALANVTNLQGLQIEGNGNYAATLASGTASIGASGTGGLGTIQDSSLEESNVNISAEFSDLIIAQRGFEANSKAITTFDTITQETINMIH
ncbi:MAG: flagellar hook protein FlgE [Terracidiphilus sp.]|jgi:flagellar hook protein FlgE